MPAEPSCPRFRHALAEEFARRRALNPRYSLRAFARAAGIDHSALSQILRGQRRLTTRTVARLGMSLGMDPMQVAESCSLENDAAVAEFVAHPDFRPDSRWIAMRLGVPIDAVNVALQRLLRLGHLSMPDRATWTRAGR